MKLNEAVREFQTRWIRYALIENYGNIRKTAKSMGKSPATMQRWVQLLELDRFARNLRYTSYRASAYHCLRLFALFILFIPHN